MTNTNRMSKRLALGLCAALLLMLWPAGAMADERMGGASYIINDEAGQELFAFGGQVYVGDEYISSDNKRYRVTQVDDSTATGVAEYVEDVVLWDISDEELMSVSAAQGAPKVALYCTHSDESYQTGDGTTSKEANGGVNDIADKLAEQLKNDGCEVTVNHDNHEPHDAGAYRRSRRTATDLIKQDQPDMLVDVHRDGGTPAKDYNLDLDGEQTSKVRLVVGRSNTNRSANEDTAKKLKKVADDKYNGLIKDIFIGKGTYNQDLMPNAVLMEFGTDSSDKDRVLKSTQYMASVVSTMLGASAGQQGQNQSAAPDQSQNPQQSAQNNQQGTQQSQQTKKGDAGQNTAATKGIAWTIGILLAVGLVFLFITTMSGRRGDRFKHFFKEVSGAGKKPDDH